MSDTILILNAGSSSVKFQLFGRSDDLPRLAIGSVTGIGANPVFVAERDETKEKVTTALHPKALLRRATHKIIDHLHFFVASRAGASQKISMAMPPQSLQKDAVRKIIGWIQDLDAGWKITAVAHRFVHGGSDFIEPTIITSEIFHELKKLIPLAALHQQHHLAAVGIVNRFLPRLPQIACFDTAFHAHRDPKFVNFAIPNEITEKGVKRYGFHGLSYEWATQVLQKDYPELAAGRVIVAHLGNGSSLCAIKNGKSVDTTMGMSVLDGVPMGTRCGAIDAGAVFYMVREMKMGLEGVERMLYTQSGLKGLSGISNDVRDLLESPDPRAKYALDYFSLCISKYVASLAVSLGGIDGLVFTGGIGEHAAAVRDAVLQHVAFLNIPRVLIIPANEERLMAERAMVCLEKHGFRG